MKKVILSAIVMIALIGSSNLMAQDTQKKCTKAKTECCAKEGTAACKEKKTCTKADKKECVKATECTKAAECTKAKASPVKK